MNCFVLLYFNGFKLLIYVSGCKVSGVKIICGEGTYDGTGLFLSGDGNTLQNAEASWAGLCFGISSNDNKLENLIFP